jgi:lysophospholipase L1-like esterase
MNQKLLSIILILFLTSCGGGGGGNVTVSGGGSSVNASSAQKIAFVGASTIAWGNWSAYFEIPIENDGVAGRESWQLVPAMDGYIASQPDKLFLMIGLNNILSRHEGVLINDISTIIDKIRTTSPKTQIIILSMLPVKDNFTRSLVEVYNNQIQSLCNVRNVKFINLYNLFMNSGNVNLTYFRSDGIHPNDSGYQALANTLKGYVLS